MSLKDSRFRVDRGAMPVLYAADAKPKQILDFDRLDKIGGVATT
jgi:hypothetical protein